MRSRIGLPSNHGHAEPTCSSFRPGPCTREDLVFVQCSYCRVMRSIQKVASTGRTWDRELPWVQAGDRSHSKADKKSLLARLIHPWRDTPLPLLFHCAFECGLYRRQSASALNVMRLAASCLALDGASVSTSFLHDAICVMLSRLKPSSQP